MAGLGDRISGKAKEVEGKVTGDEVRESQGKAQQTKGDFEEKAQGLKDRVQGAAREMTGKADDDPGMEAHGKAQQAKSRAEV